MRRQMLLLLGLASVASCRHDAPAIPPPIHSDVPDASADPDPVRTAEPSATAHAEHTAPEISRTVLGDWGVDVHVPEGATETHEPDSHGIQLSHGLSIALSRVHAAPPKNQSELDAAFGVQPNDVVLGRGATPDGVLFVVTEIRVRLGMQGMPGQTIHYFKKVSRVFASLALDDTTHVECRGYIEHEVQGVSDPDVVAVNEVCLSMRRH